MASSMPHSHVPPGQVPLQGMTFSPQLNSSDVSNTSRILASVLYQSRLEPPVFAGDGHVSPEDWLQSVNVYRTSLDLTDAQILHELPRFLAKEPKKWFSVLDTHVVTWTQFCDFFRKVFLPSDSQEQIMRGILDRVQSLEEPLPTFVAHMLSEFRKLKTPPPEQEQIDLICKHSLEKYRVALYGTSVSSGMDLLLRAHELHVVAPKLNLAKKSTVTSAPALASLLVHVQTVTHFLECAHNKVSPIMHIRNLLLMQEIRTTPKVAMQGKGIHLSCTRETSRGGG